MEGCDDMLQMNCNNPTRTQPRGAVLAAPASPPPPGGRFRWRSLELTWGWIGEVFSCLNMGGVISHVTT